MALATRPKPKVHHRKRQAKHHRQSKLYLKPYLPYLPMFAVIGLGVIANKFWPASLNSGLITSGQGQTRIETMIGSQNGIGLALIIIMSALAAAILLFRHWFRIQRTLNKGERFIAKHPWFDVVLVAVCTAGVVLTRN